MLNPTIKRHLISWGVTFVSMFFTLLGTELMVHTPIAWSGTAVSALLVTAIRGAFKATFEYIALSKEPELPEWIQK